MHVTRHTSPVRRRYPRRLRAAQAQSSGEFQLCIFPPSGIWAAFSDTVGVACPLNRFGTETLNLFISGAQNDSRRAEQVEPRLVPPHLHRILCTLSRAIASSHVVILSLPNAQDECRETLKAAPPRARMEVLGQRRLRRWTAAPTGAFDGGGDGECWHFL